MPPHLLFVNSLSKVVKTVRHNLFSMNNNGSKHEHVIYTHEIENIYCLLSACQAVKVPIDTVQSFTGFSFDFHICNMYLQ